jgi:hypothetical protein
MRNWRQGWYLPCTLLILDIHVLKPLVSFLNWDSFLRLRPHQYVAPIIFIPVRKETMGEIQYFSL